jgi:lipoprotein signal peptidase
MRYRLLFAVATTVAATDALTKALAVALSHQMPVFLPGGWALQVAHNHGVVLGLGVGTIAPEVFAIVSAVEIAALLFITRHRTGPLWAIALGLTAGGALGNVGEDRLFGSVVDWIWPPQPNIVFDLADVAVACGQVLLLSLLLLSRRASRLRTAAVTR